MFGPVMMTALTSGLTQTSIVTGGLAVNGSSVLACNGWHAPDRGPGKALWRKVSR